MGEAPTEADFRAAGFTADAVNFPLSERACRYVAKFNGVPEEKMPRAWQYAPNAYMQKWLDQLETPNA